MYSRRPIDVAERLIKTKKIQVYGHYFNSDTRTIMALLEISGVEHEFNEVDIFTGEHQDIMYLAKNPSGTIPMIIDQDCQLMGNTSIFINYLTTTKKKL